MGQDRNAAGAVGVVVIGRNEGERLKRCLGSVLGTAECIVYVDSGSSDDSVQMSRMLGVEVVELDLHIPFTAARARNEGFRRLVETRPDLPYVFFVDGDCEVVHGWLDSACRFLETHPEETEPVLSYIWRADRTLELDPMLGAFLSSNQGRVYPH